MPYLLNLPPLEGTEDSRKLSITEAPKDDPIAKPKSASKKKASVKEFETEKWHHVIETNDLNGHTKADSILSYDNNSNKTNCDSNNKIIYDFTISNNKKFIALSDRDMEILRNISQKIKI